MLLIFSLFFSYCSTTFLLLFELNFTALFSQIAVLSIRQSIFYRLFLFFCSSCVTKPLITHAQNLLIQNSLFISILGSHQHRHLVFHSVAIKMQQDQKNLFLLLNFSTKKYLIFIWQHLWSATYNESFCRSDIDSTIEGYP